jgi:hypothetical protein
MTDADLDVADRAGDDLYRIRYHLQNLLIMRTKTRAR